VPAVFGGLTGIIEGFYGRPWSWDERLDVMAWCHERGMSHYVYAPKDDPRHRAQWREPYGPTELEGFARLLAADTLRLGFAVSPGLSIDYESGADRSALLVKCAALVDLGVDLIVLALDDIPPAPGLGRAHGELCGWLADHLGDEVGVVLVPTDYTSTRPTAYLTELVAAAPPEVPIAWTGPTVVTDEISTRDAVARAEALDGRLPLIWDNYPVNDALMGDRLFLGPLRGRDRALADVTSGWLANPMVQPRASRPALASIAAYLRGESPEVGWGDAVDALGWRTFAEACDGEEPDRLVDAVVAAEGGSDWAPALARLRTWLKAAQASAAPGIDEDAHRWMEQTHNEAGACLQAVRVLEALRGAGPRSGQPRDEQAITEGAMVLTALWQQARRGEVSSFGPRCSVRPVFSQDETGAFRFHRSSVQFGPNATDRLVDYTLDAVERARAD
jgi:hyaluronoglucosaminidase